MANLKRTVGRAALASAAAVGAATGGYALASAATSNAPAAADGHGPGGFGGIGGPGGTVTAVAPNSFTMKTSDGSSVTVDTDSSTTYSVSGDPNAVSGVSVGDRVSVRYLRPAAGGSPSSTTSTTAGSATSTTPVASHVQILLTQLAGTVVSKTADQVVVQDGQGFYRTVKVDGQTQYFDGSATKTLDDVTVGHAVAAFGSVDADHTDLDARYLDIQPDTVTGTVASVDTTAQTITVTTSTGTVTVQVSASTTYQTPGTSGSLGAVAAGDRIRAVGVLSGTTLAATQVEYASASGPSGGTGPAARGRGLGGFAHGRGANGPFGPGAAGGPAGGSVTEGTGSGAGAGGPLGGGPGAGGFGPAGGGAGTTL